MQKFQALGVNEKKEVEKEKKTTGNATRMKKIFAETLDTALLALRRANDDFCKQNHFMYYLSPPCIL